MHFDNSVVNTLTQQCGCRSARHRWTIDKSPARHARYLEIIVHRIILRLVHEVFLRSISVVLNSVAVYSPSELVPLCSTVYDTEI